VVHRNELVLPAQTLRAGPAAILDFADSHLPGGLPSGRGQAVVNDNRQFHWNVNTAAFNPESAGRAAAAFATGGI